MSCRRKSPVTRPMRRTRRPNSQKRLCRDRKSSTPCVIVGSSHEFCSVSDKLEALKSLIPAQEGEMKAEQLFQETANYIVLLKTQILILQKLVDLYGSGDQNLNAVQ
ncbi:hypothetical protein NMG60_11006365 [Bertholletia excelsa]